MGCELAHINAVVVVVVYGVVPPHDGVAVHASGHIVDGRRADIGETVVSGKGDDHFAVYIGQISECV